MKTIFSLLPLITIILIFLFIRSRKRKRQERSAGYNLRGEWTEYKINSNHVPHWEREGKSKSNNKSQRKKNLYEIYYEKMKYECIVCQNIISVDVNEEFNTFFCNKCRSIFSYEIINEKIYVNVIKKEFYIPKYIKEAISLFEIEYPIDQSKLKKNYHKLISEYHPDKVINLGKEIKELSEKKTKEIIEKYDLLLQWINDKK